MTPLLAVTLVSYLRAAMPRLQEREPTLADELVLVRAYLELMQMRMPARLTFQIDVAALLQAHRFPAMALLTGVENAVRHGLDPSEQGGTICIGARATGEELRLWVTDNGVGLSEHAQPGTGLNILRARLSSFYRPPARLKLQQSHVQGLHAEVAWKRLNAERWTTWSSHLTSSAWLKPSNACGKVWPPHRPCKPRWSLCWKPWRSACGSSRNPRPTCSGSRHRWAKACVSFRWTS